MMTDLSEDVQMTSKYMRNIQYHWLLEKCKLNQHRDYLILEE